MADLDDLERALLARWDRETLLVYADALQACGDPRGELIALDCEIADRGATPELATRRRKRLYEWLGGSTINKRPWHEPSLQYGFATDFVITGDTNATCEEFMSALLASAVGPYVRGLTFMCGVDGLAEALPQLVAKPRPWIERVTFSTLQDGMLDTKLVDALIAATPRLHTLEQYGHCPLSAFPHPSVRSLVVDAEHLAVASSLPALERIDIKLGEDEVRLPTTIRHLDLARNELAYPWTDNAIYDRAAELPLAQLATLRMPALRNAAQIAIVQRMLEAAPSLEIAIARTYTSDAVAVMTSLDEIWPSHPRLKLPTPRVWSPPGSLSGRDALSIYLPTEEYGVDVGLSSLVDLLEDQFDAFTPAVREAWTDFWSFLRDLGWEDEAGEAIVRPFPAKALKAAVEAIDDTQEYSGLPGRWAQLAEKLAAGDLAPDAVVTIRRYWGW